MSVPTPGYNFGARLARVLGLDASSVRSIDIRCRVNEVVTAKVELIATKDQGEELLALLKNYRLEECKDAE